MRPTFLDALTQAKADYEGDAASSFTIFDDAIQSGASANMLDALIGFSGADHKRSFEIKISSPASAMSEREPRVYNFDASDVETLTQVSNYYKDNYVLDDQDVWGTIKQLDRPMGEEFGTVTIQATLAGIDKLVQIELKGDDYNAAIMAHKAGDYVKCHGDLHVTPRKARLLLPQGFRVVTSDELF